MRGLDLSSPDMTTAEMTRAEVEAALKAAHGGQGADFTGKRLSGLDLSGLDFSGANLRAARLNHANLSHAKLDGATLDQAWALGVDLTGASLVKASLFATQMAGAHLDGANLTGARVTADLTGARLVGARFEDADCSADEKNQSMGLMRATFKSADLSSRRFLAGQSRPRGLAFRQAFRRQSRRRDACARRTQAARICAAPSSRAPTRRAWMSIRRASTGRASLISPRRSTSTAPTKSERDLRVRAYAATRRRRGETRRYCASLGGMRGGASGAKLMRLVLPVRKLRVERTAGRWIAAASRGDRRWRDLARRRLRHAALAVAEVRRTTALRLAVGARPDRGLGLLGQTGVIGQTIGARHAARESCRRRAPRPRDGWRRDRPRANAVRRCARRGA